MLWPWALRKDRDELLASPGRLRSVPEVLVPRSLAFRAAEVPAARSGDFRELAFQVPGARVFGRGLLLEPEAVRSLLLVQP